MYSALTNADPQISGPYNQTSIRECYFELQLLPDALRGLPCVQTINSASSVCATAAFLPMVHAGLCHIISVCYACTHESSYTHQASAHCMIQSHLESAARGAAYSRGEGGRECDCGLLCRGWALQQPACAHTCAWDRYCGKMTTY